MTLRFIETVAVKQVRLMVEMARTHRYPALVLGEPGTGKTTALQRIAGELGGVYIEATYATKTVRGLFKAIIEAYDLYIRGGGQPSIYTLSDAIYSRLARDSRQLLVLDEVQRLDLETLRELLTIQERCNIALVLGGNDKRLAQTQSHDSALDQVRSRIGARVRLGKPFAEDCVSIAVDFDVQGKATYDALVGYGTRTSLRELVRVLETAREGAKGTIELRHIERAIRDLSDDPETLKLIGASA